MSHSTRKCAKHTQQKYAVPVMNQQQATARLAVAVSRCLMVLEVSRILNRFYYLQ